MVSAAVAEAEIKKKHKKLSKAIGTHKTKIAKSNASSDGKKCT